MILQRLYQLAEREGLLEDAAFSPSDVQCVVSVSTEGEYLGVIDVRQREELPAKGKRPPKVIIKGGRDVLIPVRPVQWDPKLSAWKTTDPASSGTEKPAVFLADTIPRVLSVERLIDDDSREKFQAQRSTFWRFIRFAAHQTQDDALVALARFAEQLDSAEFQERLANDVEAAGLAITDRCSFAWEPDGGRLVLERAAVQDWWRPFFTADMQLQQAGQFRGLCQLTGEVTAIPTSIKSRIKGLIPVGGRAETYLVTGIASSESFNLSGATTGMVSQSGVDGFTRALNALIANDLPSSRETTRKTSHRVAGVMFLFWTRHATDGGFDAIFDPTTDDVDALLKSVTSGSPSTALDDPDQFYMLAVSGNSARVIVRSYLEGPLPRLRENLAAWFRDLRIADISKDGAGRPTSLIPLELLAAATALDMDQVAPDTPSRLVQAAIHGDPLPDSLLTACLRRLRAKGKNRFCASRMALIKLCLLRRKIPVTETLDSGSPEQPQSPAYVCGRLMAVFEQIQYEAHDRREINANVTDKFFGTFSAAPAMLLGRLFADAQNHLRKLRQPEKRGTLVRLDKLLTSVSSQLKEPPKGKLSLHDQGLFALGYYHQRARQFEEIAEHKAAKAALAEARNETASHDA